MLIKKEFFKLTQVEELSKNMSNNKKKYHFGANQMFHINNYVLNKKCLPKSIIKSILSEISHN